MAEETATLTANETQSKTARDRAPHVKLTLQKSGLILEDGALRRETGDGKLVARHELEEITDIRIVKQLDGVSLLLGIGLAAIAVIAKIFIESSGWSWGVSSVVAILAALLIVGSWGVKLRLESGESVVHYNLFDLDEDNEGFVFSLVREWKRIRGEG